MYLSFGEFTLLCCNWHIQCNVTIVKYDHVLYSGEWCDMPAIIRKCYWIKKFYVSDVELRNITLYVCLKYECSKKLYNYLKSKINKKFGRIV